jgi:hypothetical protein
MDASNGYHDLRRGWGTPLSRAAAIGQPPDPSLHVSAFSRPSCSIGVLTGCCVLPTTGYGLPAPGYWLQATGYWLLRTPSHNRRYLNDFPFCIVGYVFRIR